MIFISPVDFIPKTFMQGVLPPPPNYVVSYCHFNDNNKFFVIRLKNFIILLLIPFFFPLWLDNPKG